MASNNRNILVALLWAGAIIILLLSALLIFLIFRNIKTDEPKNKAKPSPSASNEVLVVVEEESVKNNGEFYEPVPFKIVNNTDQIVYYYSGCGIYLPEPFKTDQSGNPIRLEGWDTPRVTCMAEPQRTPLKPKEESRRYFWAQDDYDNKVLPAGNYKIAVGYSYNPQDGFPKQKAYSPVIKVLKTNWNDLQIKELCADQLENSPLTALCYKKGY